MAFGAGEMAASLLGLFFKEPDVNYGMERFAEIWEIRQTSSSDTSCGRMSAFTKPVGRAPRNGSVPHVGCGEVAPFEYCDSATVASSHDIQGARKAEDDDDSVALEGMLVCGATSAICDTTSVLCFVIQAVDRNP